VHARLTNSLSEVTVRQLSSASAIVCAQGICIIFHHSSQIQNRWSNAAHLDLTQADICIERLVVTPADADAISARSGQALHVNFYCDSLSEYT